MTASIPQRDALTGDPADAPGGVEWGQGLRISFRYPPGPFADLYRQVGPRLHVDDRPQIVRGWLPHRFTLPAGRHRIRVDVPFDGSDQFARAELEVELRAGVDAVVEYEAPRVMAFRGTLRQTGPRG